MTNAVFAGIPWQSDPDSVKSLLIFNGFFIVSEENGVIEAKGKILDRNIKACLEYDLSASCSGLYRVSLFSRTALPEDRQKEFKSLLVEKYGLPSKEGKDSAQWENAETTGGTRIVLSVQDNPKGLSLDYLGPHYLAINRVDLTRQGVEQRDRAKELL